jgi:hypothetical protein
MFTFRNQKVIINISKSIELLQSKNAHLMRKELLRNGNHFKTRSEEMKSFSAKSLLAALLAATLAFSLMRLEVCAEEPQAEAGGYNTSAGVLEALDVVAGTVKGFSANDGKIENITVDDGSGGECLAVIDGNITEPAAIPNLAVGAYATISGIAIGQVILVKDLSGVICDSSVFLGAEKPEAASGLANGAEKTEKALKLPKTIGIITTSGNRSAAVSWDLENCPYDPDSKKAQVFAVKGSIELPPGVLNPTESSLDVSIFVDVKAEATEKSGGWYYRSPSAPSEASFADISYSDWFFKDVELVVGKGLMPGVSENEFGPGASLSRAMIVALLGRLSELDITSFLEASFTDVSSDQDYAPYAEWAKENGICVGVGDGKFEPDRAVTRQELAAIIARYADFAGLALPETIQYAPFPDNALIEGYAREAVQTACKAGILYGRADGSFDPEGSVTRAEAAAMARRLMAVSGA